MSQQGMRLGLANLAKAIETGARHAAEQAQMLDRGGALRLPRVHFFNDRVDGVAGDDRSSASMSRKASRKQARSLNSRCLTLGGQYNRLRFA